MKKRGIIILGPAASGKTRLAMELMNLIPEEESTMLAGGAKPGEYGYGRFCKPSAKILLIDDVPSLKHLKAYESISSSGALIDLPFCNKKQVIYPKLIITFDEKITREDFPTTKSFSENFTIVELSI